MFSFCDKSIYISNFSLQENWKCFKDNKAEEEWYEWMVSYSERNKMKESESDESGNNEGKI